MTRILTHFKPILWLVLVAFFLNTVITEPVQADVAFLPTPGKMVSLTPSFSPPVIIGLKVFKNNPFKFEFVMSQGELKPGENSFARKAFIKSEANKMVKYFLASLTVPQKDMWVNLSPYQHDRIIPQEFGITEMGKEMLAQDYLLKQVTASVMYPEGNVGREFWNKIYEEAYKRFGTTNIPVNTFNKVWILPDKAVVYENAVDNTAVIVESKLKVMLEEDYLALNKSTVQKTDNEKTDANRQLSNELIRQVILPLIEKEVNTGKNFATLRQVYNSLILAFWFKNKLRQSLIGKGYIDRKKTNGVDVQDKNIDQEIYNQYLKSYKKGVYNYIKEDFDPATQETIPRKYFSGGIVWGALKVGMIYGKNAAQTALGILQSANPFVLPVEVAGEYPSIGSLQLSSENVRSLTKNGLLHQGKRNIYLYLNRLTKKSIIPTRAVESSTVAGIENSVSDAVGLGSLNRSQGTDTSMLGNTIRKIAILLVGLSIMTGASSVFAKNAGNFSPEAHNNAAVQKVVVVKQHNLQEVSQAIANINEAYKNATELSKTFKAIANPPVAELRGAVNTLDEFLSNPGPVNLSSAQLGVLKNISHSAHGVIATWNITSERGMHNAPDKLSANLHQLGANLNIFNGVDNDQSHPGTPVSHPTAPLKTVTAAPTTNAPSLNNTHVTLNPAASHSAQTFTPSTHATTPTTPAPTTPTTPVTHTPAPATHLDAGNGGLPNVINPNLHIQDKDKFAQDKTNDDNWKTLQETLLSTNAPYFVIVSTDTTNMYSITRTFNKGFGDGTGHDLENFSDFVYGSGIGPNGQPNVSFKIRKAPDSNKGKVDISKINTWESIDNPDEVRKLQDNRESFVVQLFWNDANGPHSGVVYASHKAAELAQREMLEAYVDRDLTQKVLKITGIPDFNAQVKALAGIHGLPAIEPDNKDGNTIIGAYVKRNEFGSIIKVTGWIHARDIDTQVSKLPFDHQVIVVSNGGKNPQILQYWPYGDGVINTYSRLTSGEQQRLSDPQTAMASFNSYLARDGNPLERGEIIFGNNDNISHLIKVKAAMAVAEHDRIALKQYDKYLGRKEFVDVSAALGTIAGSFVGENLPISPAANFLLDLYEQPELIGRYVPNQHELQKFFNEYNATLPPGDRLVITNGSLQTVKGFYTEDDMTKLNAYLEARNTQKTAFYLLNMAAMAADTYSYYMPTKTVSNGIFTGTGKSTELEAFLVPKNQALYNVCAGVYGSVFTGEIDLPNFVSYLIQKQPLGYNSVGQMITGKVPQQKLGQIQSDVKPGVINPSWLTDIFSIVGFTVDGQSVINQVTGHQVFLLAPSTTRFHFYLFGVSVSLFNERALVKQEEAIVNDTTSHVFFVEDGHFASDAKAFDAKEYSALYKIAEEVPIGMISAIGVDGHALEVPVYKIDQITPSGKHIQRMAIFTLNALKEMNVDVNNALKRYQNYAQALSQGGVVIQYGSDGGSLDQNLETGLFKSFDQQGMIDYPSAYTFDQAGADLYFIKTGNFAPVKRNLDFFLNVMHAQLKLSKQFEGISKSYNAYTGDVTDQPDIAGTGMIAETIMAYEKSTGDLKYHQLLSESIKWLEYVQSRNSGKALPNSPGLKGRFAEPNAIVYAVFHNYGILYKDQKALNGAENIRRWAAKLYDGKAHLIRYGQGQNTFSADAQTRWFLALGPKDFMRTFLNNDPRELGQFLRAVENTFGVTVTNDHSGKTVSLLDLADESNASHRLTNLPTNQTIRIGFPEVTSEFVEALKIAKGSLVGADVQFADSLIKKYSEQLALMADKHGNLPQATALNEDSFFNGRTIEGNRSLASTDQYGLNVVYGINVLDINSASLGNNLGLTFTPVNIPAYQLTIDALKEGPQVLPGQTNYDQWSSFLSGVIEKDKDHHNPNIRFFDPLNNLTVVYNDVYGRVIKASLVPSPEKVLQNAQLTAENAQMDDLMNQAKEGIGAFARGGVIFETAQGQRIGLLRDSTVVDDVLKAIEDLPVQQQSFINFKQYSNFVLHNFKLDGKSQDVVVTIVFPLNKSVASELRDSNGTTTTTAINEGGRVRFTVNDHLTTVFNYDPTTGIETSTASYANFAGGREEMVKLLMANQSLDERRAIFVGLKPADETSTVWAGYTDPTQATMDNIDPNQVKIIKSSVNNNTGEISTQAYGLFTRPVWEADQFYVTENHFDDNGKFKNSVQYKNIGTVAAPKKGDKLFENNALSAQDLKTLSVEYNVNFDDHGNNSWVVQKDIVHGTSSYIAYDNHNFGRSIIKFTADKFSNPDGKISEFNTLTIPEYKPDFFGGEIPFATREYNAFTGKLTKVSETLSYDTTTKITVVREKNIRNGEVIEKTIEPQYGQSLTESKLDSLGRKQIITNTYSDDFLHVSSMTLIDGVLAVEAQGAYTSSNQEWTLNQTRWGYHQEGNGENTKFVSETVNSHLSAFGHLIYEDTIYPQNTYEINGYTYLEENRRYIPEYDSNGNVSRSTEGVLRNGAFVRTQITEYSDYGDFFVAQNSLTKLIVDGREIPYTSSHLTTTPQQYLIDGNLNFEVTNLIYDKDKDHAKWIETRDKDGHVVAKTQQVFDDQQKLVGEQMTRFEAFNSQNIATKSIAEIIQNGTNTVFAISVDKTTLDESKLGLVRTEISNHYNGLVRQELRDRRGRVIENGIEGNNPTTGALEMQRKTIFFNFNDFDIAHGSVTKSLLDGDWVTYTTSSLLSDYNEIMSTHSIRFNVHNNFLSSSINSVDWQEIKDYRGHVLELDKGHFNAQGKFETTRKITSSYRGIPGLIDVADSTASIMVIDGVDSHVTDKSHLITPHGVVINDQNINTIPAHDIFNSVHKVRYQGTSYFDELNGFTSTARDYQEIRNNLGNVEITLFGTVDKQGHFNKNRSLYRIYLTQGKNYGNFDIAKSTVSTIGGEGQEEVVSYSNNTTLTDDDKYLIYKTKKGLGSEGLVLTGDIYANHDNIAAILLKPEHSFKLTHQTDAITQVKDADGREIFIFSGYSSLDTNGFGTGAPTFVTVNQYDENKISQPIAADSHTYMWNSSMGEHNPTNNFTQLSNYINVSKPTVITTLNNLTFAGGLATYKADDMRETGLRAVSLSLDGALHLNYYQGSGVDGPASFNLYFDQHELPAYGMEKLPDGTEKPYSLYRPTLFDYEGNPYVLVDEFVNPVKGTNGQFDLSSMKPKSTSLIQNGTIKLVQGGTSIRTTPFSSVVSMEDKERNSVLGLGLNKLLPTDPEKVLEYGRQHADDNTVVTKPALSPAAQDLNYTQQSWKETGTWFLKQIGGLAGTLFGLYGGMLALRALGYRFYNKRGENDINSDSQQDFEDLGFTMAQSQAILDERFNNGAFLDNNDFKNRLEKKLNNAHKLSEKLIPRWIAQARFKIAFKNISKIKYVVKDNGFNKTDSDRLSASAQTSVKNFMATLIEIYNLKPEQQASYESAVKMFNDYLTKEQLQAIIASQHYKSLIDRYSKQRAIEVILKLMFQKVRDNGYRVIKQSTLGVPLQAINELIRKGIINRVSKNEVRVNPNIILDDKTKVNLGPDSDKIWAVLKGSEYKSAIRNRVEDIIKNTGLDKNKEYSDQIFSLKDTFLKNIEQARLLPEGLQFHNFDVSTDLLAYSWDDLHKAPDMERQVRSDLVSVEKLFFFQVIFQRSLYSLSGQGRAEEYLWAKYVYPSILKKGGIKDPDLLDKIKAFKQIFMVLMTNEVTTRLENNRDPKGKVLYFQNIINEEVYNDAFRYLIGQKSPTLNDAGWILSDQVKKEIDPLRNKFLKILDGIKDVIKLPNDQRAKEVNKKADQLKPVILAFVGAVDKKIGMPVVKGRLNNYWKLTVIPLLKMVTNGEMRRRIFSKGGPYNQSAHDMVRRLNNYAMMGAVSVMFGFLAVNMFSLLPFMAIPSFIMLPWPILVTGASSLFTLFAGGWIKKLYLSSLEKKLTNATKEEKEKALKSFNLKLKLFYGAQTVLFFGSLLLTPFLAPLLHAPAYMMVTWPIVKLAIHAIPVLIFIDTWRLSFYAMNYLFSAIAVHNSYVINNVYEITNKSKTNQIVDRLMSLFTDVTPAIGKVFKTRGQERLAFFVEIVKEMTSNEDGYFYAEDKNKDNRIKLSTALTQLADRLVDNHGKIIPVNAADLQEEIETFVNRLNTPISVDGISPKKFDRIGIQKLVDYINRNYRLDKGAEPSSWDHVIPMTNAIHGFGEDWYFSGDELIEVFRGNISKSSIAAALDPNREEGKRITEKLIAGGIFENDKDNKSDKPNEEIVRLNLNLNETQIQEIAQKESIDPKKIDAIVKIYYQAHGIIKKSLIVDAFGPDKEKGKEFLEKLIVGGLFGNDENNGTIVQLNFNLSEAQAQEIAKKEGVDFTKIEPILTACHQVRDNIKKTKIIAAIDPGYEEGQKHLEKLIASGLLEQEENNASEVRLNPKLNEAQIRAILGKDFNKIGPILEPSYHAQKETREFTHRIGMLARYKTELFLFMVNRLTPEGSNERTELLKLIKNPTYFPIIRENNGKIKAINDWNIYKRGRISKETFLERNLNADRIWNALIDNKYILTDGTIESKLNEIKPEFGEAVKFSSMILPGFSDIEKEQIYNIMQQAPSITEWVNLQLPTGYSNTVTQTRTLKRINSYHARMFKVANPEAAAQDKFRIIEKNLTAVDMLDKVLGGKLRELLDVLVETEYTSTYKKYPDGTSRGLIDPYKTLRDNFSKVITKAADAKKYDIIMLTKLLDLVIHDRLFPTHVVNGKDVMNNESHHSSKWASKAGATSPFYIGPVLGNFDADHRFSLTGFEFIPNHLLEYYYLPGLGASTPIIQHTLTSGLGVFGDVLPISENGFTFHAQGGKMEMGGLTAYGKFFERVSALRNSEGITDSYVAEDSLTALMYRLFGYVIGRAGSIAVEKGWMFSFFAAHAPTRKWIYQTVESSTGRTAMKLFISVFTDWPYLINNFWLDGFGYSQKKPSIIRYVRWLVVFYLIMDWNLFNKVPLAVWAGCFLLSQSISNGLLFYKIFDESLGYVKGTLSFIKAIATRMIVNFMHKIFETLETVGKLSVKRLGRFIPTAAKGANQTRMNNKEIIYTRSAFAIQAASPLALGMLTFVGISLKKATFWLPTLIFGFAGVAAPNILNPVRTTHRVRDNFDNLKDAGVSFWWGLQDDVEAIQNFLRNLFSKIGIPYFKNAENEVQVKALDMYEVSKANLGERKGSGDELAGTLGLFHQVPNHSTGIYGRPPVPVITGLLEILASRVDTINYDFQEKYFKDDKEAAELLTELNKQLGVFADLPKTLTLKEIVGLLNQILTKKDIYDKFEIQSEETKLYIAIIKSNQPTTNNEIKEFNQLLKKLNRLLIEANYPDAPKSYIDYNKKVDRNQIQLGEYKKVLNIYLSEVMQYLDALKLDKSHKAEIYGVRNNQIIEAENILQNNFVPESEIKEINSIKNTELSLTSDKGSFWEKDVPKSDEIRVLREGVRLRGDLDLTKKQVAKIIGIDPKKLTGQEDKLKDLEKIWSIIQRSYVHRNAEELYRANWLLTQSSWLASSPIEEQNRMSSKLWNAFFGIIGTDSSFQAISFYLLLPVLRLWDNGFRSKKTKENYQKSLAVPKSTPVALNLSPRKEIIKKDKAMQADQETNTPVNRIARFLKPAKTGGIDFTKASVSVKAPNGGVQVTFDDPAILRLLLNADGLAPIIYDVKAMTPSMANHFVGLDY